MSPQGRGLKPRSKARFNSLKGMPMSKPVLAAAKRVRQAFCMMGRESRSNQPVTEFLIFDFRFSIEDEEAGHELHEFSRREEKGIEDEDE